MYFHIGLVTSALITVLILNTYTSHGANANLFVSAENSQFDNYMSGPQVIEVVVIDRDINDTDEVKGEPDVTVNGKLLRMVQAVDGNWYGYFADRNMALIADATTSIDGAGLDFATFCSNATVVLGVNVSDTAGVAIPFLTSQGIGEGGNHTGTAITNDCDIDNDGEPDPFDLNDTLGVDADIDGDGVDDAFTHGNGNIAMNVLRETKDIVSNQVIALGQIGLRNEALWPFIQLYPLNPTGNVVVQYNKGRGGVQTTTLTFDTVDQFAGVELDRSVYPSSSEVHATITDLWLNIDPTDEDSWTFGTTGTGDSSKSSTNYQVFDENGNQAGDARAGGVIDLSSSLSELMCEDNCVLLVNSDVQNRGHVITLQDNDDSVLTSSGNPQDPTSWQTLSAASNLVGNLPVTVTEQGPNSGVFGTYDESDTSQIKITNDARRGTSANFDYNETGAGILVSFDFATIDIQPTDDEWNSGEAIPVVLTDQDANRNSRADEDLDLNNPDVDIIPSVQIGHPLTLESLTNVIYTDVSTNSQTDLFDPDDEDVQKFSKRAMLQNDGAATSAIEDGDTFTFTLGDTFANLKSVWQIETSANGHDQIFNTFNYDLRSLFNSRHSNNNVTLFSISIQQAGVPGTAVEIAGDLANSQGHFLVPSATVAAINSLTDTTAVELVITIGTGGVTGQPVLAAGTVFPIVIDFFSFGFTNDGIHSSERISNMIVRLELEETGDNTGEFEGELEYIMLNQLNISDPSTYAGLSTIADDPVLIVIEDLTDEDSVRVNYNDLGEDGVVTQVADQEEARSHSGVVSFDADSYNLCLPLNSPLFL